MGVVYTRFRVTTTLLKENLFTENESLRSENEGFRLLRKKDQERIAFIEEELDRMHELLIKFKKQTFGPRGERWETEEQALMVFNEAEAEACKPESEAETEEESVEVSGFKRKRGKRSALPEHLPREIVVVELPEAERFDDSGNALKVVGKEVSEKFEYQPPVMKVIEYHRLRYGMDAGDPVKTAPPVPSIIPKGIVTPSLLSAIVTAKYADGLPLYRQEDIFARIEVELSRSSMARWIVAAAEYSRPIWNILEERLMESSYLSCDETWTQVLKEEGRKPSDKSWMWVRCNPNDKEKIILFDYDPHRSGDVAKRLFAGYSGTLQCDGYGAYNILEKQPGLIRIGCNMHGRRGFRYAADGKPKSKKLAETALKFYRKLYDIEDEAKGRSAEERHALRQEKAKPIWDEFKIWADSTFPKVPRRSSIGDALHYFLGEYDYLIGYLKDGRLEMDNGFAERVIKNFAIGRNNWLFSDTEAGAEASALFYSFIITAKLNGVNPYAALKKIFEELPLATSVEDFERLANILLGRESSI
jgi:transposase